jgi:uncharacterized protein (DUF433 family)
MLQTVKPEGTSQLLDRDTEFVPPSDPRAGVISIDPERMSGTPCFVGTRVPIKHLWDYLEGGDNVDEFMDAFEGVSREQVMEVLRLAFERLLEGLPKCHDENSA